MLSQPGRSTQTILVPVETLADVLSRHRVPRDFGVLSVDAEAMDYEVLLGLNCAVWRPRVIITENYPPKEAKKSEYLESHHYRLCARLPSDTIWAAD